MLNAINNLSNEKNSYSAKIKKNQIFTFTPISINNIETPTSNENSLLNKIEIEKSEIIRLKEENRILREENHK